MFNRTDKKLLYTKKPNLYGVGYIKMASTYSPTVKTAVPSAQAGLTSLFGMGRGGPCCNRHLKLEFIIKYLVTSD